MKSDIFLIAGCFSLGIFLSNFSYLMPRYFWLCTIAGIVISIALCFPGKNDISRRWSALAVLGGILANNWEMLGKLTVMQAGIGAVVITITSAIGITILGSGGKNA